MVRHGVEQGPALRRSRLSVLLATLVTAALVALALRTLDAGEVAAAFRDAELVWLVPSVLALVVSFAIRAWRWQLLFEAGRRPPLGEVGRALAVCLFFNSVLPFRAGEVARLLLLHRRTGLPRLQILGTIAAERIYDVLALLALLAVALPWLPDAQWLRVTAIVGGVLAAAVVVASVALAVWGDRLVALVVWPLRFFRSMSDERREVAGHSLLAGVVALHRPRAAAGALALTVAAWLVIWLSFWLLLQGFDFDVGGTAALLVLVATGFSLAVPSGPAGVGVFEAAVVGALFAFGVDAEAALSYGLVLHAVNVVPYVVGGAVALAWTRGSIVARDADP